MSLCKHKICEWDGQEQWTDQRKNRRMHKQNIGWMGWDLLFSNHPCSVVHQRGSGPLLLAAERPNCRWESLLHYPTDLLSVRSPPPLTCRSSWGATLRSVPARKRNPLQGGEQWLHKQFCPRENQEKALSVGGRWALKSLVVFIFLLDIKIKFQS